MVFNVSEITFTPSQNTNNYNMSVFKLFLLFTCVLLVTQTSLLIWTPNFLTFMFGCLLFLFGHAIHIPRVGVLGCVSAGVPVDGVFPGDSIWTTDCLPSSRSAIQGSDHWPFTCSNSWTFKTCTHGRDINLIFNGYLSYLQHYTTCHRVMKK